MKQEELNEILRLHKLWLNDDTKGKRADLRSADLRSADLRSADLRSADLRSADLCGADLRSADLCGADLCGAGLCGADLCGADLRSAGLCGAGLCGADLRSADLCGADLCGADLSPEEILRKGIIVKRKMTGWKKCQNNIIVKLEIPKGAIVFSINNNKCRTNIAKVIEVIGAKEGVSKYDEKFVYKKGKTLKVNDFDLMYNVECSTGIHFFRTRKEAEDYE